MTSLLNDPPDLFDPSFQYVMGEWPRAVYQSTVVCRPPAVAVDVDFLRKMPQGNGLHRIRLALGGKETNTCMCEGERESEEGRREKREDREKRETEGERNRKLTNKLGIVGHTHSTVVIVPSHGNDPSTAGAMAINTACSMAVLWHHITVPVNHINT